MLVRRDLPLGTLAAQLVHAAGESSPGHLPDGTHAVVLGVKDEAELAAIEARLLGAGVSLRSIRENDGTYAGALMSLGLTPAPKSTLKRFVSSIPLLREVLPAKT